MEVATDEIVTTASPFTGVQETVTSPSRTGAGERV